MKALTVYDFITLIIVLAASIFGIVRMFAKKAPMYFRLIVCGVLCFAFQYIYYFLALLCKMDMPNFYNICFLGIGGSFIFFVSANYGQFNSIVDEYGKRLRLIRLISLLAPLAFLVWFILICLGAKNISAYTVLVLATSAVPIMIGSYFNLKYLVIKNDSLGLLKGVKPLNAFEIVLDIICYFYIYNSLHISGNETTIFYYVLAVSVSLMVLLAEWGRKAWHRQF